MEWRVCWRKKGYWKGYMSKYRLIPAGDLEVWDAFAKESLEYTIFSNSKYLEALGRNYQLFYVYKGHQRKAGLSLVLSDDGRRCILDDFIIYNGILFDYTQGQKATKARSERLEITEFIIDQLDKKYETIEMVLSPDFEDMRPFLWHNYHSTNPSDKFLVELRYTSYIDISEFFLKKEDEDTMLYKNMDTIRQSDLRKAVKNGLKLEEAYETNQFLGYYNTLMCLQGIKVMQDTLDRMGRLIHNLIQHNLAKMFVAKNETSQITYITLFTFNLNKGCYLFGAGNQELSQRYDGTFCIWEAMKRLSAYGVHEVDMEGVNSPQRGSFKLSFGGNLRPYYQVSKR